jgi:hypothetical protein
LEQGRSTVFAVALEWPGWCRSAKSTALALAALDEYRERYAKIVTVPFGPEGFDVIGTLAGTGTTDFGAPDVVGPWDALPLAPDALEWLLDRLQDCWNYFDAVVADAPATLRRGPRGGGRDRDEIVDHVREAERAYCSRAGFRVAPRTPWDEQRDVVLTTLRTGTETAKWPAAYAVRRIAWHIVDHAWEIEDKGD